MEGVIIVVLVIVGISIVAGIIKAIFEWVADTVKGIFGFITEHFVAIVIVLIGGGLLCVWIASVNSPEGQRRRSLRTLEAQYAQELQDLQDKRDSLRRELGIGAQGNAHSYKVKTVPSWKEAARRRDSSVTEDECRQMFLKYLYKQARLLQMGSASWPGLTVRIRNLQEEANALLPDSEQSDSAKQNTTCSAEEAFP